MRQVWKPKIKLAESKWSQVKQIKHQMKYKSYQVLQIIFFMNKFSQFSLVAATLISLDGQWRNDQDFGRGKNTMHWRS